MKIKTIEKLEDVLDRDLAWRKKELLDLKGLISISDSNRKLYTRAGIALLSAHFEGFIKYASNMYVCYISTQRIPYKEIKNCFVSMKFRAKFHQCGETEKLSVYAALLDDVEGIQAQNFKINGDKLINTESNPTSKVLKEILTSIGLEYGPFESKSHFIDYSLLSKRHEVVHGEMTNLDPDDFFQTLQEILDTIELFRSIIIEAAEMKLYLKRPEEVQVVHQEPTQVIQEPALTL